MRVMIGVYVILLFLTACSQQQKDKDIKQMINAKAKEQVAFAGVNYSISEGIVTLSGVCPTEQEKATVESQVKQLAGVKTVHNVIATGPVLLTGEHLLKQAVDSVLADFPSVDAAVQDSIIYLYGKMKAKEEEKLMSSLKLLGAKGIANQTLISQNKQAGR